MTTSRLPAEVRSNLIIRFAFVLAGLLTGQNFLFAYSSVAQYGDVYIAAGEGHRLDILSSRGEVMDSVILAAGSDDVKAVAVFKERLLLGGGIRVFSAAIEGGSLEILGSCAVPVRGSIVSMDADGSRCYAITDSSEIAFSEDGIKWTVIDFNECYRGFYPEIKLIAVAAGQGSVAVTGVTEDGRPAMFTSSRGAVWSPRDMDYRKDGTMQLYVGRPTGLCYDPLGDQFIMLCEGGEMFYVPACSHCNHPETVESCADAVIRDMCPADTYDFLIVGDAGFTLRLSR